MSKRLADLALHQVRVGHTTPFRCESCILSARCQRVLARIRSTSTCAPCRTIGSQCAASCMSSISLITCSAPQRQAVVKETPIRILRAATRRASSSGGRFCLSTDPPTTPETCVHSDRNHHRPIGDGYLYQPFTEQIYRGSQASKTDRLYLPITPHEPISAFWLNTMKN